MTRANVHAAVIVFVACALAFALRWPGVGFGLPAAIEDDSGVLVRQVEMVRDATPAAERDENWGLYPHLIAQVAGRFAPAERPIAPATSGATLSELLDAASATHRFTRAAVLLLALLAVPLTWSLARRFVARDGAALATGLVATSLLFQCFSQEARPHAAAAATALLTLVACLRLVERGDRGSFLLAGVTGALALGTLQSNALVLVPILAACGLRKRGAAHGVWTVVTLGLVAVGWWLFYPHPESAGGGIVKLDAATRTLRFFGHNVVLGEFDARGFATVFWSLWSFETLASALALIGIAIWLAREKLRISTYDWLGNAPLFVVGSYALVHLVAIGMYARSYERFCLQLVPILAVSAAWGFERATSALQPTLSRSIALFAWSALALVPAMRFAILRTQPLAQEEAAAWIREHVERDASIGLHPLVDVPLLRTSEALASDPRSFTTPWRGFTPWRRFQPRVDASVLASERWNVRPLPLMKPAAQKTFSEDPEAWLAKQGARYVVLPIQATREGAEVFRELHATLRLHAELAARFPSRADGGSDVVLGFEDRIESARPHWMWSLLAHDPISVEVVEVWRRR